MGHRVFWLSGLMVSLLWLGCSGERDKVTRDIQVEPILPVIDSYSCTAKAWMGKNGPSSFIIEVQVLGGTAPFKVSGFDYDWDEEESPKVDVKDTSFSDETVIEVVLPGDVVPEGTGIVEVSDSTTTNEKVTCNFDTYELEENPKYEGNFGCEIVTAPYPSIANEVVYLTAYALNAKSVGNIRILNVTASQDSHMVLRGLFNSQVAVMVFPWAQFPGSKFPLRVEAENPVTGERATCTSYQLVAPRIYR